MGLFASIRDAMGRAFSTRGGSDDGIIVPGDTGGGRKVQDPSLFELLNEAKWARTPAAVTEILERADLGDIYTMIDLAHQCRQKDAHLHAVLAVRENMLSALRWQVIEPPNPDAQEKKAAEWTREVLSHLEMAEGSNPESSGLGDLIEHMQFANYFGFSSAELQWVKDGRYLLPHEVWLLSHRRFMYQPSDGALMFKDQNSNEKPRHLLRNYAPGNFIQHQPRIVGDIPAKEGLFRVVVWPCIFRNWNIKDWLQLAEIGWKPWVQGTYKRNSNTQAIAQLREIIEMMTTTGFAVKGEDQTIDVSWPKSAISSGTGKSNHHELAAYFGWEISKAALGAIDVVEPGPNGSLGAVISRTERLGDKIDTDAQSACRSLNRQMITPMIRANFPGHVRPSRIFLDTRDFVDAEKFGKAILALAKAGAPVSLEWIYDQLGGGRPLSDKDTLKLPKNDLTKEKGSDDPDDMAERLL